MARKKKQMKYVSKEEWLKRMALSSEIRKKLIDILPHGSGINGKWEIDFKSNFQRIHMSNTYDVMSEGSLEGYVCFTAVIDWDDPKYFRIKIASDGDYLAKKHDLRTYLSDTLAEAFEFGNVTGKIFAIEACPKYGGDDCKDVQCENQDCPFN